MKTVPITVQVPTGKYCALFEQFKPGESRKNLFTDEELTSQAFLLNRCPLVHRCESHKSGFHYYCSVVNTDTHLGMDKVGLLKHNYSCYTCPSIELERTQLEEVIKEKSAELEDLTQ